MGMKRGQKRFRIGDAVGEVPSPIAPFGAGRLGKKAFSCGSGGACRPVPQYSACLRGGRCDEVGGFACLGVFQWRHGVSFCSVWMMEYALPLGPPEGVASREGDEARSGPSV